MAALAIFGQVPVLAQGAARVAPRRRLLRYSAAFMSLGTPALFHAVAGDDPSDVDALAAVGFMLWVAGVALLLLALTADRFPAASRLAVQLVEAVVVAFF